MAKRLGFSSSSNREFHALLKLALRKNLVKVIQGGFTGDSMHHPKLVILLKPFDEISFIQRAVFPSYAIPSDVEGYHLIKKRTGIQRELKNGEYSKNHWWYCKECFHKISIGKPYASKIDYSLRNKRFGRMPIVCKCISCFLKLIEEVKLEND